MKNKILPLSIALILTVKMIAQTDTKGLKDYYKSYFQIGVAVAPRMMSDTSAEAALIKKHFSSMTCENVMKMGPIHPEEIAIIGNLPTKLWILLKKMAYY